jgi:hypothetical protein
VARWRSHPAQRPRRAAARWRGQGWREARVRILAGRSETQAVA